MTPETELASRRACCPVCRRRGREVTVAWAVQGHGLYLLARRPRQDERDIDDIGMLVWQHAGASYLTDEAFFPPIWPGASTRMPEKLARTPGPNTTCRYGHRLTVPARGELDRMLAAVRGHDVVYLPAARV